MDDEETIAELIREVLKRHGMDVDTSAGGEPSLETAAAGDYDLVISDFAIPGLNGLEFVRRLRQRGASPGVLIVSAFLDPETIVALEAEPRVIGLMRKPFDIFDLVSRVHAHFDAGAEPAPRPLPRRAGPASVDRAAFSE